MAAPVPMGLGANISVAAGSGGVSKPSEPNSIAPSDFLALPDLEIKILIASARFASGSLNDIEPESSMIASMLFAGTHDAATASPGAVTYNATSVAAAQNAAKICRFIRFE